MAVRYLQALYVDDVTIMTSGGPLRLHVWMNPETKRLVAVDNLEVDMAKGYINDPYDDDVRLLMEDTFTGLPK